MANHDSNIVILNEYLSLPIIISNWDTTNPDTNSPKSQQRRQFSTETFDNTKSIPSSQQWSTGFADYVDGLWSQMTTSMKQQMREACVEVLRRTDDARDDKIFTQFDDDARLLD